jgi:hypothetical protein
MITTPELEAAKLYKRIIAARIIASRAEAEYVEARDHLTALEAEYRAAKLEYVL